jgi:hypothetical protein
MRKDMPQNERRPRPYKQKLTTFAGSIRKWLTWHPSQTPLVNQASKPLTSGFH